MIGKILCGYLSFLCIAFVAMQIINFWTDFMPNPPAATMAMAKHATASIAVSLVVVCAAFIRWQHTFAGKSLSEVLIKLLSCATHKEKCSAFSALNFLMPINGFAIFISDFREVRGVDERLDVVIQIMALAIAMLALIFCIGYIAVKFGLFFFNANGGHWRKRLKKAAIKSFAEVRMTIKGQKHDCVVPIFGVFAVIPLIAWSFIWVVAGGSVGGMMFIFYLLSPALLIL